MSVTFRMNQALAQSIVEAAKAVIGYNVNFMNPEGKVIASTDYQRIGQYHQAGDRVFSEGKPIEVEAGHAYLGSQVGVNYPIVMEGHRIGVIGISGDPEECRAYGFLITKLTEVLIKEQMQLREVQTKEELRASLARLLVFGEGDDEAEAWQSRLKQFGIDTHGNPRACVILVESRTKAGEHTGQLELLHQLVKQLGIGLYAYLFPHQYLLIIEQRHYGAIVQRLEQSHTVAIKAGVGHLTTWEDIPSSYRSAGLALQYALSGEQRVHEYVSLELGMLLSAIDGKVKRDYRDQTLAPLTPEDRSLLSMYFARNMSLKDTAESLHLHKNTLQYRLDRIAEKSGLDPRQFQHAVKIHVALLMDEEIGQ